LHSNTGGFTAFWADQHHVRDIDLSLELDAARVEVATGLRLHLLLMLGANVHTQDDNTAFIQEHIDYFTALALVFQAAANDFDSIAFTNLDSHT
jgi:hypothetical protein